VVLRFQNAAKVCDRASNFAESLGAFFFALLVLKVRPHEKRNVADYEQA
jgi:hypothetical protein